MEEILNRLCGEGPADTVEGKDGAMLDADNGLISIFYC